jgi:hypothetical protein
MADIRDSQRVIAWPVESPTRALAYLGGQCDVLRAKEIEKQKKVAAAEAKRAAADKAEKERQARLLNMIADPQSGLKRATELVHGRGKESYTLAAEILADLSEAVGGDERNKLARKHAAQLFKANPTLRLLKLVLHKKGIIGLAR